MLGASVKFVRVRVTMVFAQMCLRVHVFLPGHQKIAISAYSSISPGPLIVLPVSNSSDQNARGMYSGYVAWQCLVRRAWVGLVGRRANLTHHQSVHSSTSPPSGGGKVEKASERERERQREREGGTSLVVALNGG